VKCEPVLLAKLHSRDVQTTQGFSIKIASGRIIHGPGKIIRFKSFRQELSIDRCIDQRGWGGVAKRSRKVSRLLVGAWQFMPARASTSQFLPHNCESIFGCGEYADVK